jgi:hypothetical protein
MSVNAGRTSQVFPVPNIQAAIVLDEKRHRFRFGTSFGSIDTKRLRHGAPDRRSAEVADGLVVKMVQHCAGDNDVEGGEDT